VASKKIRATVEIQELLKKCSLQQLQFFANVANNKDFKQLDELIKALIDIEKEYIFDYSEQDSAKLAVEKAFSRGKVASFVNLRYIFIKASEELERRLHKNG
jgi:hypothetical protein